MKCLGFKFLPAETVIGTIYALFDVLSIYSLPFAIWVHNGTEFNCDSESMQRQRGSTHTDGGG
jgi:hypothetical protein